MDLKDAAQRFLRTEGGQQFLEALESTYSRRVFDENPTTLAYKAGQHDLVKLLRDLSEEP